MQGAVELCDWMSEHGTDAVLLNISSAVYNSPTENQIYEIKAQLPDCPLTPAPAPAKAPPMHSRAASMVSRVWACGCMRDSWHAIPCGAYAVCFKADHDLSCPWPESLTDMIDCARPQCFSHSYQTSYAASDDADLVLSVCVCACAQASLLVADQLISSDRHQKQHTHEGSSASDWRSRP